MIRVHDLVRRYGSKTAVDGISFELERGEVVGFLGLNGAGKTTTMRILSGYMPATSGRVEVAGFDVLTQSLEVRRRIGYLPESVPLYREHRLVEMLEFHGRLHAMPRAHLKRRIGEVLDQVGLADRARTPIADFSKGMRQRAGLAVALLPEPQVLILDEPTSGLDPLQRREVRELVRRLGEQRTVLFSSHILSEVESVAPRVVILHRGKIAADGRPQELGRKLGGGSHVRVEAFVGQELEQASRLLRAIPGVQALQDLGRLGIHHVFQLRCDEDLREDVGALARAKGWALRELSFQRPTLEQLFARIALDVDEGVGAGQTEGAAGVGANEAPQAGGLIALGVQAGAAAERGGAAMPASAGGASAASMASAAGAAGGAKPKIVYNLNPFDRGWERDLSRPKAIEPDPTVSLDPPRASSGSSEAPREPS